MRVWGSYAFVLPPKYYGQGRARGGAARGGGRAAGGADALLAALADLAGLEVL
jgi:hypothetical protein